VGDVTIKDVLIELSALKRTPAEYRYAFVVARAFFNWCIQEHIIERSPMDTSRRRPPSGTEADPTSPNAVRDIKYSYERWRT
jgi:hypothetical protein